MAVTTRAPSRTARARQKMSSPTLRQWKDSDFEPFAAMNADPDVMRHFLARLTRRESLEMFDRLRTTIDRRGWGGMGSGGGWRPRRNGRLAYPEVAFAILPVHGSAVAPPQGILGSGHWTLCGQAGDGVWLFESGPH